MAEPVAQETSPHDAANPAGPGTADYCARCGCELRRVVESSAYAMYSCPECLATMVKAHTELAAKPKLLKAIAWSEVDEILVQTASGEMEVLCTRCGEKNPGWASHGLRCIRCQNELAAGEN